jgi:hypothetical protein
VAETQKWAPHGWNMTIKLDETTAIVKSPASSAALFEPVPHSFVFKLACEHGLVSPLALPPRIASKPCDEHLAGYMSGD